MSNQGWAALVAIAFIALVAFMFSEAIDHDFATVWAGVGTIVGVVTGAIPSYFFKQSADKAQKDAAAVLLAADKDAVAEIRDKGLVG